MTPLCALIVEDSEDDAALVLRELRRGGYDVTHRRVDTAEAMRAALAERSWELVLSDYSMPSFNAAQALAIVLEVSPATPMIIVSGTVGEDIAVELVRSGARDYLLKDSLKRLVPAIRRELDAARELTARRETEEALRLMESRFLQAQKMEAIGRLAGGVAHDFNNLLTAILGYSDLLLDQLLRDDPLRKHVHEIHKAGVRATSLTKQLLVFSRHQTLERKVLDLNAIVTDMERMLARIVGEDLTIRTVLSPDLGNIRADGGQLEQVLLNLTVNARDAMPRGGRITIETANVELDGRSSSFRGPVTPGAYVMLAVSDTGVGIAPDVLVHLFEPFFTTKAAGIGTGLGLSTVYGITQSAGGALSIDTEVGRGSTFKVYFPRVQAPLDSPAGSPERPLRAGSETILLVEDDELIRELAQTILRSAGYEVIVAPSGDAALRAAAEREAPVHLLLTDVVMPNMSGKELADRLEPLRPGLRVLYTSGYTSGVVLHDDVVGSGAAFIQKPFTVKGLLRKVSDVLAGPPA